MTTSQITAPDSSTGPDTERQPRRTGSSPSRRRFRPRAVLGHAAFVIAEFAIAIGLWSCSSGSPASASASCPDRGGCPPASLLLGPVVMT